MTNGRRWLVFGARIYDPDEWQMRPTMTGNFRQKNAAASTGCRRKKPVKQPFYCDKI